MGMPAADRLLPNRQRALIERPRPGKVALGLKQVGEVVEARRRLGMLGAEDLFADCQRIAKKRLGLRVSRAPVEIAAHPVQKVRPICSLQSLIRGRFVSRAASASSPSAYSRREVIMTDDGESTIRRLKLNDIRDVVKEIMVA